jgi:hypothetical protein
MKKITVIATAILLTAVLPVMALAADTKVVKNVKQVNTPAKGIAPDAVGGGTISCQDGGNLKLLCPWNVTSSSKITYSNVYVEFSDYFMWSTDYPINTPAYTIYDVAEDPLDAPGYYTATLQGEITTLDGVYPLVPVTSASTYVQ